MIYWSDVQAAQIQIELRKVEEAGRDKTSEVNEDIKKTGQLVVGLIDAAAKTQSMMYGFYNSIASKNKQGTSHCFPLPILLPLPPSNIYCSARSHRCSRAQIGITSEGVEGSAVQADARDQGCVEWLGEWRAG